MTNGILFPGGWALPGVPAGLLFLLFVMTTPFSEEVKASEEDDGPVEEAVVVLLSNIDMDYFNWLEYLF